MEGRSEEHAGRIADLRQARAVEHGDAVGHLRRHPEVVGHKDEARAELVAQ